MAATRQYIAATHFAHGDLAQQRSYVVPPSSVGGIIVFEPEKSTPLDFDQPAT